MRQSNCCGARVEDDSDICLECGEHCEVEMTCPMCDGIGTIDVLDDSKELQRYITPPEKTITCPKCEGEGTIIE